MKTKFEHWAETLTPDKLTQWGVAGLYCSVCPARQSCKDCGGCRGKGCADRFRAWAAEEYVEPVVVDPNQQDLFEQKGAE